MKYHFPSWIPPGLRLSFKVIFPFHCFLEFYEFIDFVPSKKEIAVN